MRRRPAGQKGLTLKECRDMEYLSKVVDETLRYVSFSLVVFREAQMDVNLNGIPISLFFFYCRISSLHFNNGGSNHQLY